MTGQRGDDHSRRETPIDKDAPGAVRLIQGAHGGIGRQCLVQTLDGNPVAAHLAVDVVLLIIDLGGTTPPVVDQVEAAHLRRKALWGHHSKSLRRSLNLRLPLRLPHHISLQQSPYLPLLQ